MSWVDSERKKRVSFSENELTLNINKQNAMLKRVKQKKISDQIFEQIRDMIYRGEYTPSQRLISERDLAKLFGVGRPTVRVAIQKLIDLDLVESRRGAGVFVLERDISLINAPLSQIISVEDVTISEFLEVRLALESRSAELAAIRATDEDLLLIEKSLDRLRTEKNHSTIHMRSDMSFHMNIAYSSKNPVQIQLMKSFYDVQYLIMEKAYLKLFKTLKIDDTIFTQHEQIAAAIKKRDPILARKIMEEHISLLLEKCIENGI